MFPGRKHSDSLYQFADLVNKKLPILASICVGLTVTEGNSILTSEESILSSLGKFPLHHFPFEVVKSKIAFEVEENKF